MARVTKKSFLIMSLLGPILFALTIGIVVWVTTKDGSHRLIQVIDESEIFKGQIENTASTTYRFLEADLEQAKADLIANEEIYAVLYIPQLDLANPKGIKLYSLQSPGIPLETSLESKIKAIVEDKKLLNSGISQAVLDDLTANIDLQTISLSDGGEENESSGSTAFAVGYVSSILLYMFIFMYGTQIMQGIIEEKTNRIIEVVIASVRPFQLMMGKILGIAAVGLTQFVLWIAMTTALTALGTTLIVDKGTPSVEQITNKAHSLENNQVQTEMIQKAMENIGQLNLKMIIGSFLFYFLGGYLLYGALLAGIGAAVDSDADSKQFMLPITLPLIFSILLISVVTQDPHGSIAFWLSIIPFTSPIIMIMRLPFEVPIWQVALSMSLLVVGFCFTTWVASRIYRVGIFMHGVKVNYKTLGKWLIMKN